MTHDIWCASVVWKHVAINHSKVTLPLTDYQLIPKNGLEPYNWQTWKLWRYSSSAAWEVDGTHITRDTEWRFSHAIGLLNPINHCWSGPGFIAADVPFRSDSSRFLRRQFRSDVLVEWVRAHGIKLLLNRIISSPGPNCAMIYARSSQTDAVTWWQISCSREKNKEKMKVFKHTGFQCWNS